MNILQHEIQHVAFEMLASTSDPIILLDTDKRVLFLNESAMSRLQLNVEDKLTDFLNDSIDEEKDMWVELFNENNLNLQNAELFLKINNQKMIFKLDVFKVSAGDVVIHFKEITEAWLFERRMNKQYDLINQHIIMSRTDLNGVITEVSQAFSDLSGYSKEELIGEPHSIVRHPDMPKAAFEDMWTKIEANEVWRGQVKNRKKNGGHYWVAATVKPVFNYLGKKYGYISIRYDITSLIDGANG